MALGASFGPHLGSENSNGTEFVTEINPGRHTHAHFLRIRPYESQFVLSDTYMPRRRSTVDPKRKTRPTAAFCPFTIS